MKGVSLNLSARFGHFKRPETSNNPCTYSYMHKVAFIGLMGAVVGIHRDRMKNMYPDLCDDLLYSVELLKPVQKEGLGFTKRKVTPENFFHAGQRYQEVLRNPSYCITVALLHHRSVQTFESFMDLIKKGQTHYPIYFGIASCPCSIREVKEVSVSDKKTGRSTVHSVFSAEHEIVDMSDDTELIYERIPTHCVDHMYTPGRIVETVCPTVPIVVEGDYYTINDSTDVWMM